MASRKHKIDSLILNYFIQEGYQEAAISFAKETGIELADSGKLLSLQKPPSEAGVDTEFTKLLKSMSNLSDSKFSDLINAHFQKQNRLGVGEKNGTSVSAASVGYSTISQRKKIKLLILKGSITEAIQVINEYFPTVLDTNNLLYFKLLRLNLIEMIRSHKLDQNKTSEKEKLFLSDILAFVRENLINKVIHLSKLLKELEITMLLLCFNFDPEIKDISEQKDLPEELRNLFNLSLRHQSYCLVNKAIFTLYDSEIAQPHDFFRKGLNRNGSGSLVSANGLSLGALTSRMDFDFSNFEPDGGIDIEEFSEQYELDTLVRKKPVSSSSGTSASNDRKRENDEDISKLQELALESRLEKIIKLWALTEQRLLDLNIIKEKRFKLANEV